MRVLNYPILVGGSGFDLSATRTSNKIDCRTIDCFAIQIVVSAAASLNGTFKLQCSCDDTAPTNWTDISGASQAFTAVGSCVFNASSVGWKWMQLVWTSVGGTGTASVRLNNKSQN